MTTIKVPKQVQIGGHIYRIALSADIKDSDCHAAVNHRLLAILVSTDRPESQKIEGLGHEIIHIINNIYGCDLEERQIDGLGQGLFQVFSQVGLTLDWSDIPVKEWDIP